jgi:hypothetical protein
MQATDDPNLGAKRARRLRALQIVNYTSSVGVLLCTGYLWLVAKQTLYLLLFLLALLGLAGTVLFDVHRRRYRVGTDLRPAGPPSPPAR